jgi:hypothetical protein
MVVPAYGNASGVYYSNWEISKKKTEYKILTIRISTRWFAITVRGVDGGFFS